MRREITAVTVAVLLLAGCSKPAPHSSEADIAEINTAGQCLKDIDCKGDRICDAGICKTPVGAEPIVAPPAEPLAAKEEPKTLLSFREIQTNNNNKPYGTVRAQLSANGFSPDKTVDASLFNMSVAGDPAACGTKGCQVPWARSNEMLCVGVSINDNLAETDWNASISTTCD